MSLAPGPPPLDQVVADLRVLRERGLVRIRHTDLGALEQAAARTRVLPAAGGGPGAVEALLRAAVENLSGGSLGAAATATFGLARSERDRPAQDRRRRAALVYGVSVERFRKHHERVVLEQVAEEILKLCQDQVPGGRHGDGVLPEFPRQRTFEGTAGGVRFPLTVHTRPVELLSGVDIVVVPQNVYLEMPQHYKSSVAAAVGRSAARHGHDGQILEDLVRDELRAWVHQHGRPGLPVAPGTVVVTSPGDMASRGIRRLYHAAVASPRPGTNDYDVEPTVVAQATRNVFAVARAERARFDPPLASVCFPLLGSGRGGLSPATSFAWLWAAMEREVTDDGGTWDIHFIAHRQVTADLMAAKLAEARVIPGPGSQP